MLKTNYLEFFDYIYDELKGKSFLPGSIEEDEGYIGFYVCKLNIEKMKELLKLDNFLIKKVNLHYAFFDSRDSRYSQLTRYGLVIILNGEILQGYDLRTLGTVEGKLYKLYPNMLAPYVNHIYIYI